MVSLTLTLFSWFVSAWCCCCSVYTSWWTLCDPMGCSTPGFPVLHDLPEFAQTHVHWVRDAIQPSHPLIPFFSCSSDFPSIRVFSNESALCNRWPKYLSFGFSISSSNEYSGLISLQSKGLSRVFSNTTVQNHQFWYIHFPYCHFTSMNLISHISKIRGLCYRAIMRIRGIHFLSWLTYPHDTSPENVTGSSSHPLVHLLSHAHTHTTLCNEKIYTGLLGKKQTNKNEGYNHDSSLKI